MQFIDTHIHLQDYKLNSAPEIIAAATASNVSGFVCVSAGEADWVKVEELSKKFSPKIVPAYGVHPWYSADVKEGWSDCLKKLLIQNPKSCIGECGLDKICRVDFETQKAVFCKQIALAKELDRPLLLHLVKAVDWMNDFWSLLEGVRFVLHSFSGPESWAKKIDKMNGYASFSQAVLRRKNFAELVNGVSEERILLESDGPYQSLCAGVESSPCFLSELVEKIAFIRGEKKEILAERIYQNSKELFYDAKK